MATEKRLIYSKSAEKELVDAIQNIHLSGCDWVNGYCEGIAAAHSIIQSMPAVDAAEVVADPNIMELCFRNGENHMRDKIKTSLLELSADMPCVTIRQVIKILEDL